MIATTLIILSIEILFFLFAWLYVSDRLCQDFPSTHTLVRISFSCTLAVSCILFLLLIFEVGQVLDERYVHMSEFQDF